MKRFALAGAAVVAMALAVSPAPAQVGGFDGLTFIKAVRDRDANKALELVQSRGSTVINARESNGDTALTIVIARRDPMWTSYLLSKGADPNLAGRGGDTPLITAARAGFEEGVAELLARKVKVDATNKMGETALIVAVQQRSKPIVGALLKAGADPNRTDAAAGYSARDYAKRDARGREILTLIENSKAKPKANDLNSFKL